MGLPFDYNLERIIDDFILLAVFVGNDFLPNLPDLHIHENGLEKLFDVYKRVLPKAGALPTFFFHSFAFYSFFTDTFDRWLFERSWVDQYSAVTIDP